MMIKKMLLLLSTFLLLHLVAEEQLVIGYVTGYGEEPSASQIRALTHVNFCFLSPDGLQGDIKCSYGKEKMERVIKNAKLYDVKTLISFGGGGLVITDELMANDTHRAAFVSNMVQFVEDFDLDGIDNDWEPDFTNYGPNEEDEAIRYKNNLCLRKWYNPLLKEIRDSLDARFGKDTKLLTAAVGSKNSVWYSYPIHQADNEVWPDGYWDYLDLVNFMSYGSGGGGLQHGDYNAAFGPNGAIAYWGNKGMPKEKMIVGVPFYAAADWSTSTSYNKVIEEFPDIDTTQDTIRHNFGSGEKLYGFTSVHSMKKRVSDTKKEGLPGIMFWSMEHDLPIEHPLSLLRAINPPFQIL